MRPGSFLRPSSIISPLLMSRWFSRLARRFAAVLVQEDSELVRPDVTQWHTFDLIWKKSGVRFLIDGELVRQTNISPRGPLGLVLWLDNQYAAWYPDGRLKYGTLETDACWIEIRDLMVK
jgi:hypothetical protein